MAQDAYPANSTKWDGKRLTLTENTQKNMMKKAYTLDAENMLQSAGYQLEGNDAIKAIEQNGITQEQLIEQEGTYSNLIATAIEMLQRNANKNERIEAVNALEQISYTNLYIENQDAFILPPKAEKDEEEVPVQPESPPLPKAKEPENKPVAYNPYYNRSNEMQKKANQTAKIARATASANLTETMPDNQNTQSFVQSLIPHVGKSPVTQEVKNMGTGPKVFINTAKGNAKMAVQPRALPNVMVRSQPQQTPVQQPAGTVAQRSVSPRSQVPQPNRPLLNSNFAARMGGRAINPVAPKSNVAPVKTAGQNMGGNSLAKLMVKKKRWF